MSKNYLLGFDIGGSGGRCLLVDVDSAEVVTAARAWRSTCTPETAGLGFDLDLDTVFTSLADACREVVTKSGASPSAIRGISTTAMREGMAVISDDDEVLLATPNRDARGVGEGLELAAKRGEEFYKRTGHWPYPIFPAARLLWLKNQRRDDFDRARLWLSLSDWLVWRLSGEAVAEPTQGGESLLLDLESRDWAWDLIDSLELPHRLFAPVHEPGTRVGELGAEVAALLGLSPGIPVMVGGADSQCALLGTGTLAADELGVIAGSTAPVQMVASTPVVDDAMRLWTGHHLIPNRWILESNGGPLGETLEWMARLLYPDTTLPVARLFGEAELSSRGAGGTLSTVGVNVWDARELRTGLGNLTLSQMLTADTTVARHHTARAIVEGLAFGLRANAEQVYEVYGRKPSAIRLGGGVSRSPSWRRLLAEVLGAPVEVSATAETSALGAAMCAGVGAGVFSSLEEAAASLARVAERHVPDDESVQIMAELYDDWESVRRQHQQGVDKAIAVTTPWVLRTSDQAAPRPSGAPRPKILVTADMDDNALAALARLGDIEYASFRKSMKLLAGPSLVEALEGVQVFITEVDLVDAASLEALPDLRAIATCRSDPVNVGLEACTAFGVPVLHAPGRNAVAVADLTLAFILMHARKLAAASTFLHAPGGEAGDMGRMGHAFSSLQGTELGSLCVGLVGLGAVGREVAKRLRAFGATVLVADPYIDAERAAVVDAELVDLESLLERCDVVSLHAAVSPETEGLIGADELARMRRGALFVNTARAALVDEAALVDALSSGHLGGAALDVFAVEPPASDHPLLQLDSVIATPHVAGNTTGVAGHQGRIIAADLERLLHGERPHHVLNAETLDAFGWTGPRKTATPEVLARLRTQPPPAVSDLQKRPRAERPAASQSRGTAAAAPVREANSGSGANAEVRGHMERILSAFVTAICSDDALAEFARTTEVTLNFQLADLGLEFYFTLANGRVTGSLGTPADEPEVQLKMSADVLDGMFTGRINAMQEAMEGRLSFTGDAAKAMTLQQLQRDLMRLYTAARDEIGDPGDLASLTTASTAGGDTNGVAAPRGDRAQEVVAIVNELYASQLITATGGNVSTRTEPGSAELWITPSQLFKGELSPEVLVRIGLDGRPAENSMRSPSSERLMHTAVYEAKPEAEAVIHCHAPHATILANTELPFLPISTEAAFFGDIPRVPFIMPGSVELADAIAAAIGDGWAVLMKNHGLLVAGRSLRRAADMAEIVERSAEIMLGCYAVGKEPPVLPDDVVVKLRRVGDLIA